MNDVANDQPPGRQPRVEGRFPVVEERPLLPPERRWLRGGWRNPDNLPVLPPGCMYVFGVDGRFKPFPRDDHLRETNPDLVNARWVSIVNVRHRRIYVRTYVPSRSPASDFRVWLAFGCVVDDPAVVAQHGLVDLRGELQNRVRHDPLLAEHRHKHAVDDLPTVRDDIISAISTAYRERPPEVPGMRITFDGVSVEAPPELRQHLAQLRDTTWTREIQRLSQEMELERVEHAVNLLKTPERSEAAAVARGDTSAGQAAARMFEERNAQTQRLIDQVEAWISADGGKRAPIDRRHLAETLFERLTGVPAPAPPLVDSALRNSNGAASRDDGTPYIPDMDKLDGM